MDDTPPIEEARAALHGLAEALDGVRFPFGGPDHPGELLRASIAWTIRGYLIPRLGDLDSPLVAVLIGSTGSGKSTLLNSLAGSQVSEASVVRPTTSAPVVWCRTDIATRYLDGPLSEVSPTIVGSSDPLLDHLTIIDAPDVDSVEEEHRKLADALLRIADVCLYVTTPRRYADAVPWAFLESAHRRDVPILYLLNRADRATEEIVTADLVARMTSMGLVVDADEVIPIHEQPTDEVTGALPRMAVSHIRSILGEMAEQDANLTVSQATLGSLDDVVVRAEELRALAADEDAMLDELLRPVRSAWRVRRAELESSLAAGTLLRGEIVGHWTELIAGGQLGKVIDEGLRRVRSWRRRTIGGSAERVLGEAKNELAAVISRRIDLAAADVAAAWSEDSRARGLLEKSLWRMGPATPAAVERGLEDWSLEVRRLVSSRGGDRQSVARAASLGVNAVAVVAMLAVFSQSGGLTGGEVGIAAGAAAAQQVILEKLFGEAAMKAIVAEARERLVAMIDGMFEGDLGRFEKKLSAVRPRGVDPLVAAEGAVRAVRERLHG